MHPILEAAKVYAQEDCPRSFWQDVQDHFLNETAYVISTPEVFVMARPVNCLAASAEIVDPNVEFPRDQQNAWLVYLLAGSLRKALDYLPYQLPMIGWERKNCLRWYELAGVCEKVGKDFRFQFSDFSQNLLP